MNDAFPNFETPLSPSRRLFANRTLNMKAIAAVGFDMDYTLVHYRTEEWERRAYDHALARIAALEWKLGELEYDHDAFTVGLIVDQELGNVVKANRFGFVKRASHGMRMLSFEEQRAVYSRVQIDLAEPRFRFMNTLFSLSETCLFAQLVELIDAGRLPAGVDYEKAFRVVRTSLDAAHLEGELKAEIVANPDRFVELDEELPVALLDLKHAGKKLMVITNSEWGYARSMMSYAFDRFVPGGWRTLFELVIVGARKPDFFTTNAPIFEIVDDSGLLRSSAGPLRDGAAYLGGHARLVEEFVGRPGEDILYVGDHMFADVHVTKSILRWRTALVLRALEAELSALESFHDRQAELDALMLEKERLESVHDRLRIELQREDAGYGPKSGVSAAQVRRRLNELRRELEALDGLAAPLSRQASELVNLRWGPPMRAGNDKSQLARQVERYADVYTSRVANFLHATPFAYVRSPRGSLPHDP